MTAAIVTLTGPPGSGKTTAGRKAAALLRYTFLSAGASFRDQAAARGISLAALGQLAEKDPAIDRALDDRILAAATPGTILDGRITGALLRRRRVSSIYLVVTADESVRVERLAARDQVPVDEARRALRAREASEADRYYRYYGIRLAEETPDLVVDATRQGPDDVARRLAEFVAARTAVVR